MAGYIQRYPFAPKATWWKRYTDTANLGKRIIYVATPTLGFEIDGFPQTLTQRQLFNSEFNCEEDVDYVEVAETTGNVITPIKVVKLLNKTYIFNPTTSLMEEQITVSDELEIIDAVASNIIRLDKSVYIRKFAFDLIQITNTQNSNNFPMTGMILGAQSRAFKTHMFFDEDPNKSLQVDDLIVYENKLFIVQDTQWRYYYTPLKHMFMEFSVTKVR